MSWLFEICADIILLDPSNCHLQAHMRAQKASKEQQIEVMNKQYKQLESRLDEMLSRIAKETEEIKDLEQQLTDGNFLFMSYSTFVSRIT